MLKSFFLKALRLIVLILLLVQIASVSALAQEIQSSRKGTPQSPESKNKQEQTLPVRSELTTEDQKSTTPSTKVPESPPTSQTDRPVDPYSKYYDAIKNFNEELYGKGG